MWRPSTSAAVAVFAAAILSPWRDASAFLPTQAAIKLNVGAKQPSVADSHRSWFRQQEYPPNRRVLILSSSLDTTTPSEQTGTEGSSPIVTDAAVCGGGPAGLLSAIMLTQKFPDRQVHVFDRLPPPPSPTDERVWSDIGRYYLIGLGGRGITSLQKFGVWDDVAAVTVPVPGRMDFPAGSDVGVETIRTDRKFQTHVLPREKLVSVLHQHIERNYGSQVTIHHNCDVQPTSYGTKEDDTTVLLDIFSNTEGGEKKTLIHTVSAGLLIAADGTSRTVANDMEQMDKEEMTLKPFKVTRYEDDNQRVYKTVPFSIPEEWRNDLNYSARSPKSRVTLEALPANDKGDFCGVLLLRSDDEMAKSDVDPVKFRAFLDEQIPAMSKLIEDKVVEEVAKKPSSNLPFFRMVGPRLNQGKRTILLGDCIHTVKPYFGMGANSALEDVKILSNVIDENGSDLTKAVEAFSKRRAKDSRALVRVSRTLDRPGVEGTFKFIIPIILDSIFHKMAPKLFAPNIIVMLQNDEISFVQAARRKRLDRAAQLAILGSGLAGVASLVRFLIRKLIL